jgi:hypothetical protein
MPAMAFLKDMADVKLFVGADSASSFKSTVMPCEYRVSFFARSVTTA